MDNPIAPATDAAPADPSATRQVNDAIEAISSEHIRRLSDKALNDLYAMLFVADYGIAKIDENWDKLVPRYAVPMLREMGVQPKAVERREGEKSKAYKQRANSYALSQRREGEASLARLPFMLASYVDILRSIVVQEQSARRPTPPAEIVAPAPAPVLESPTEDTNHGLDVAQ